LGEGPHDLDAGVQVQFVQDARDVGLYGAPGQVQLGRDIGVGPALADDLRDARLAGRQRAPAGGLAPVCAARAAAYPVRPQACVGAAHVPGRAQQPVHLRRLGQRRPRRDDLAVGCQSCTAFYRAVLQYVQDPTQLAAILSRLDMVRTGAYTAQSSAFACGTGG
jgi:hypothetical protein